MEPDTQPSRRAPLRIANLSSDTPDRTRDASAWTNKHGASFLTGGVMVPAPMFGTEAAFAYYSGPREVFASHTATLSLIGAPRYLGEDPGLAQLMYQAHLDVFLTSLSGFMHATALVGSAGMSAEDFIPEVMATLAGIPAMINAGEQIGRQIDTGTYPGALSTATMMGASAAHLPVDRGRCGVRAPIWVVWVTLAG